MTEAPGGKSLLTVEMTEEEAQTLVELLATEIRRRTAHLHTAVQKRAAIEIELKRLQAVSDKVRAARATTAHQRIPQGEWKKSSITFG
jgi:16S rRNA C967 or C1407 C5-methylase (RsmB/RsmF family)